MEFPFFSRAIQRGADHCIYLFDFYCALFLCTFRESLDDEPRGCQPVLLF